VVTQGVLPLDGLVIAPDGSLTQRALAALSEGPLPTPEVARRVLGITGGGAKAAAAAVFALLGTDARFHVDAAGVWSLAAAPAPPSGAPARRLRDEEWAVVDVETTGGSPGAGHRVTEVAAVRVAGGEIRDAYATLVNPERPIPAMITRLTGIDQAMVQGGPRFAEVAPRVARALEGCVFVAHNAAFDWRFVSHEMRSATGRTLAGRRLCTVRLARRLLPELPSRGLDGLALYFGLEIESRHRALDDAMATAKVLIRMIGMLEDRGVEDWAGLEAVLGARKPRAPRKRRAAPRSMEAA
jgi:DNA polymerase III epsilon subunit family exonuclease